jgi:membrane associated rhomboid family serine protease
MPYVIVMIFMLGTLFLDKSFGYSLTSPWWTHFTYVAEHTNAIHLIINSVAFISVFRILQRFENKYKLLAISYFSAVFMSFFAAYELPTVGASGMVYALIGVFIALILRNEIRFPKKRELIIFFSVIVISLTLSYFKSSSNFALHFLCLVSGFVLKVNL